MVGSVVASALSLVLALSPPQPTPSAAEAPDLAAAGRAPRREAAEVRLSPDARLGLGLGLGLTGGLVMGTGIGLALRHRQVYPRFVPAPNNAAYVAAVSATDTGAAMIGAGLGLGASALTAGLGGRDRVLWGELAAGGTLAIAGVAWYVTEWQRVQKMLYDGGKGDTAIDLAPLRRETAAATFIGAGVGLAFGAGVALLTRYLVARRLVRPGRAALGGGPFGAGLLARF
ncbi:hypothetical protein [Nannocystis punicea]|uniref:Uncharacterized protein n=1 Tax=Nannocystis punicea TaxID=2995304 RepID=A0ABY7HC63_9BACT|nr:hypothetical protein [Nannocystis poenicansa]WAS96876.1 hypothetical protein O0S08_12070 [Nannocystis poenicansa]